MILREQFRKHVDKLGPIRKAWFTTFNLDMTFFETYVLPVVIGDSNIPKTRRDFEALQLFINDNNIDVRIFCDQRVLDVGAVKKTSVPVHDITMPTLSSRNQEAHIGKAGLFHPKVIYIEGEEGALLASGSANLTVSGWGRNREVFVFQTDWADKQLEQVNDFFRPLFEVNDLALPQLEVGELENDVDWEFIHSFQNESFLERFFQTEADELWVFSPYFSSDLSNLLSQIRNVANNQKLPIAIIPDLNSGQKIRTRESAGVLEELEKGFDKGGLSFYQSPSFIKGDDMVHAKLWLTSDSVGIGSWNCTEPGTNIRKNDANNVEAGFILRSGKNLIADNVQKLSNPENKLMNSDELKAEALKISEAPNFSLRVIYNWKTKHYTVHYDAPEGMQGATLNLPDVKGEIDLSSYEGKSSFPVLVKQPSELLRRRIFIVNQKNGASFEGYIVEIKSDMRPVLLHDDLSDVIDSLVFSQFGMKNTKAAYSKELSKDDEDDEDDNRDGDQEGPDNNDSDEGEGPEENLDKSKLNENKLSQLTYYRLFKAMKNLRQYLAEQQTDDEFIKSALVYPGSVKELVDKAGEMSVNENPVFRWFFAQEINQLVSIVNNRLDLIDKEIPELEKLFLDELPDSKKRSARGKFMKYILEESGYE